MSASEETLTTERGDPGGNKAQRLVGLDRGRDCETPGQDHMMLLIISLFCRSQLGATKTPPTGLPCRPLGSVMDVTHLSVSVTR